MKCSMCENDNELTSSSIVYRYKDCGLDNVILHGVKESRCENCGEVYYNFGNIENLHRLITQQLVLKDTPLVGAEIRFLRKFLGYSSATFAKLVGYEIEHLSRIENGRPVQTVFDHLVKALVLNKLPNRNYDLHDLFLDGKAMSFEWLEFSLKGKDWVSERTKISQIG
jgi:transcriptional regulator with XRE-family HTH domain